MPTRKLQNHLCDSYLMMLALRIRNIILFVISCVALRRPTRRFGIVHCIMKGIQ